MGWVRMLLATVVAAISLAWASPVHAQDDPEPTGVTVLDGDEDAQPESGIVRDEDTSATVRRIRRDLIVIAALTTLGLVVYVWHTSPARRVRVAARRADSLLATDVDADDHGP